MKRPESVRRFLGELRGTLADTQIERLDRYTNELFERALVRNDDGTVFVLTGDIPAMWIRDSTWQLRPLLATQPDAELVEIIAGVSRMQARQLTIDPYANAFNREASGDCWHRDFEDQSPWVFERKFEVDSLAAFFELAVALHRSTGTTLHLDNDFWHAVEVVLNVVRTELSHDPESYVFVRVDAPASDFLSHDGRGAPFAATGLVWSGFRPSDDRCLYPFHIPANAHLSVTMVALSDIARARGEIEIAAALAEIGTTIRQSLLLACEQFDRWPYEIDGLGNALFVDDPNFPSLLSMPFLGWCETDDARYLATRAWLLSEAHPLWRSGKFGEGFASDHTPEDNIWPLSIAMRGLTAQTLDEAEHCLAMLEKTDAGTGSMHESFNVNDAGDFTRPWFSWADMAYCDLVLHVARGRARGGL